MSETCSSLTRRGLVAGLIGTAAVVRPSLGFADGVTRSPIPPARPELVTPAVQTVATPGRSLAEMIERSGLSGETAAVALDAESGETLESHRDDLRMAPASVAKAVTALYGLQVLGAAHRFVTRIEAGGPVSAGRLQGDLILRGGGDPGLVTEDLARLADTLRAGGLREVTGRLIVDDTSLPRIDQIDPGQPAAAGYNPAISGMNLNFNRVHFSWDQQGGTPRLALDARSEREVPPVRVIDIAAAGRDLPVYVHDRNGGRESWSVAASALRTPGSRWLPVRSPGLYAGDVLRALLLSRGISAPAPETGRAAPAEVLAEHRSPPLTDVLREMLRHSTNITAEVIGLAASLRLGGPTSALEPSARRMNDWIATRYGARGLALIDHSGLGPGSRIAPQAMARYLLAARREGALPDLLRRFALRDAAGQENPDHPVTVLAKTGTLNFVSTLAGYAQLRGGRTIVFAIFSADMDRRRRITEADGERPPGTRAWAGAARGLQQALIERWTAPSG